MNPNIPMNLNNMMNPNMNNMINNLNDINNMMMQNNNINQNTKQQILDLINQNIQMTETINMNNKMIKSMIENSDFKNDKEDKKDIINDFYEIDFFPRYQGRRINVLFTDQLTGNRINMITPVNIKMKDLINAFYIKNQIYEKYIFKKDISKSYDFYFLYNGYRISENEEKTISECGLVAQTEVIVFAPKNNMIGG